MLGPRPAEQPVWTGPESAEFAAAAEPLGHVLRAFGQGAETAWDHGENLGYSDDVNNALKKAGIYPDVAKGQGGLMRAYNEAIMRPAVSAVFGFPGAVMRGISSVVAGGQAAVNQLGQEVGLPLLGREVAALPEAFPLFGAELGLHVPIPERGELLGRELGGALSRADIDAASDLKVIGLEGHDGWMGYGASVPSPEPVSSITPTVQARVRSIAQTAREDGIKSRESLAPTDIHEAARDIAPDTFAAFDPLVTQTDVLRERIAEAKTELQRNAESQAPNAAEISYLEERLADSTTTPRLAKKYADRLAGLDVDARDAFINDEFTMGALTRETPEIADLRDQLQKIDYQMRDLAPDVSAAYREAARQFPETQPAEVAPEVVPAKVETPAAEQPPAPPIETPQAAPPAEPAQPYIDIRDDVAAKLTAAGRPEDEARAAAEVVAAHYEARAARFGGQIGTAAELYRDEAPDIRAGVSRARVPEMAQSTRGKIKLTDGRAVITLMRDANASTFIHETGHAWLEELTRDAKDSRAPADLITDNAAVREWLGAKEDAPITTRQHEKFARGFERYMMEGTSPSRALDGVFAQFRRWLTSIYQTVQSLRAPINDNIRAVFDRMLSASPERSVVAPDREMPPPLPEKQAPKELAGLHVSGDVAILHEGDVANITPENATQTASQIAAERAETIDKLAPEIADEFGRRANDEAETGGTGTPGASGDGGGSGRGGQSDQGADAAKPGPVGGGGDKGAQDGPRPGPVDPPSKQPAGPHATIDDTSDLVDKAGNIRLDNLNSPEDVKQVLRDLAAQNDDFMVARGGVIPDVQRRAMADSLGLTPDTFIPQKPDGVSPSIWAEAVQKLTFQASDEAARFGRTFGESGSPADAAAYLAAKQRLLMIADHFSTLTAEAGRTLRVFDKAGFSFTGDMVATMERDTGRTLFQLQREAKAVGAMETTAQRSRMMQDAREPTAWQKAKAGIVSYFVNNLISGPITHAGYAVGNTVTALFKAGPLTVAEATIDAAREALGGPLADRVYFGEVGAQIYGGARGMWDGFAPGYKALKTGLSYMEGAERLAIEAGGDQLPGMSPMGESALRPQAIPGRAGYALETPSRVVSAIHTVFYSMNYEREIARQAFRTAANEGLDGAAFSTRVADLTMNPPTEMVQAAHDEALVAVLMKRPAYGSTQQKFVSIVNNSLPLKLAMPFMQIGMNILDEGLIKNTPLALASQTMRDNLFGRNGDVARTQAYARVMVGSGIAAGVMGLAAEGILTGAGPTNPNQRRLKEAEGWKPYSIRIGDTYYPFRKYLGPLGPLVGGAASIYESAHLLSEGEVGKAAGSAVFGFAAVVSDETWMKGLSDLVDATRHWDTDGEKYLRNLALDFIPFSVGVGQVARMVDQYQREVHSWTAAARNKLPGLSEGLMPQRDWTGNPVGSHTMMSPSVWKNDRAMAAMEAAEMYPAKQRRDVRGVPLNDQQYDDLTRISGGLAKMRMDMLVNTPGFTSLPAGIQRTQMEQTLTSSRKAGEDWLMIQPGNENIIRQATAAKSAQMQGQLPAAVKAARQGTTP